MHRLKDINWNHLYAFYEVAKAQSLQGGAEVLKLSPSTLSEQLKKLESRFNKKLFKRGSKGLLLTNEGAALFEHSKIMFEEGSRVLEKFSDNDIGGYPVNIGIEESISYDLAVDFASQYWDSYAPFGTVNTVRQIEHETLIYNLVNDNIDWAVSLRKPKRKQLDFAEIDSFEVIFACSIELYDKFKNKEDILINIPFAETSIDKNINKIIYQHLAKHGVRPKEKIHSDHPKFIQNLCQRGRCVMFMAKNPLNLYPNLKVFSLKEVLRLPLYVIWKRKEENLISIKKLKELIQTKFSNLPDRYEDIELQIEASDVSDDLLK